MRLYSLKRLLVGSPLPTAQARHERLGEGTGLAFSAPDTPSSVAYATEEILRVLIVAGPAALIYSVPIAMVIGVVTAIVISSYRQTVVAYPQGASDYIVAKDNLGTPSGLTAGAALLIDYTLTVAVSVSAGGAALTSAAPPLYPHRLVLRGVRPPLRGAALPLHRRLLPDAGHRVSARPGGRDARRRGAGATGRGPGRARPPPAPAGLLLRRGGPDRHRGRRRRRHRPHAARRP